MKIVLERKRQKEEICRATREEVMPRKQVDTCADVEAVQEAKEAGCSAKATFVHINVFLLIILVSFF